MKISSINNTTFNARIKIAKPDTAKLLKGTATTLAGTASLYTGLNASNLVPGDFAKDVYNSALNEQEYANADGLNKYVEGNEDLATSVGLSMYLSLPLGGSVASLGSNTIVNKSSLDIKEKQIPN